MMRVLVTGANSFLGTAICRTLEAQGHAVTSFTRAHGNLATLAGQGVLADHARNAEVIYHLAQPNTLDVTIQTLDTLGRARKKNTCIFFTSSVAVYGVQPYGVAIQEGSPLAPISENGRIKKAAEDTLRQWDNVCIVRLPQLTGKGVYQYTPARVARLLHQNAPVYLYHQGRVALDFLDVLDAAHALARICEMGPTGVYNFGTGMPILLTDFAEALKAACHSASELIYSGEELGVNWAVLDPEKTKEQLQISFEMSLSRLIDDLVEPELKIAYQA